MKKMFALSGIAVSAVFVLMGILVLCNAFTGSPQYASSALYTYDSGYATFGADFYNYVTNNAAEAASAARTISQNVRVLFDLVETVSGICMMGFGLLGACFFGYLFAGTQAEKPLAGIAPTVDCATFETHSAAAVEEPVETVAPFAEEEPPVAPVEETVAE